MGLLLTLILGGLAGWLASIVMHRAEQGILLNVIVGIVGAFLANVFLTPLFGVEAVLDQITLWGFLMSVLGAVVLLAIVNLFTRNSIR